MVAVGCLLLIMAFDAQRKVDSIGATNDPVLQDRVSTFQDQRNALLITSMGAIFMGLFAIAILAEPSLPLSISDAAMVSTAKTSNETVKGLSLKGSALYLPSMHGLTRQRVFIPDGNDKLPTPPSALSDELIVSPGSDGSSPGMLFAPLGLDLLDRIESDLNTKIEGAGIEGAEGTLQALKHGLGIMKDFHFKERDGKTVLRVEYSSLADSCRQVRANNPETCRQQACLGCSCLLAAASRATGKVVRVLSVDNTTDSIVFTLDLVEW